MEKKNLFFKTTIKLMAFFLYAILFSLLSACEDPQQPVVDPPATPTTTPATPPTTPPTTTPTNKLDRGEPNDLSANATSLSVYVSTDTFHLATTTDIDYFSVKDETGIGYWDIYAIDLKNLSTSNITLTLLNTNGTEIESIVCPPGIVSHIYFPEQDGPTSARLVKVTSSGTITTPAVYTIDYRSCFMNENTEPNDSFQDAGQICCYQTEFIGRIIKTTTGGTGDYDFIKIIVPARVRMYYKVIAGAGATIYYDQLNSLGNVYGSTKQADSDLSYYYDNTSYSTVTFYYRVGGVVGNTGGSYAFQMIYTPIP